MGIFNGRDTPVALQAQYRRVGHYAHEARVEYRCAISLISEDDEKKFATVKYVIQLFAY